MKNISYYLLLLLTWANLTVLQAQTFPRDSFEISGRVLATSGHPMPNVAVTLVGPSQTWVDTTEVDGVYTFEDIPERADYYLQFEKNHLLSGLDSLDGLSPNDVWLLQKHILYLQRLSPFGFYAGDGNGNGGISTLDIVLFVRLLHGFDHPNAHGWRFMYAYTDYEPDFPSSPIGTFEHFLNTYPIYQLKGHLQNIDFVGLKIGDADQTANPFE